MSVSTWSYGTGDNIVVEKSRNTRYFYGVNLTTGQAYMYKRKYKGKVVSGASVSLVLPSFMGLAN